MSTIMDMISKKLGNRNLILIQKDHLIKKLFKATDLKRCFESSGLIRVLETLGWEERLLDYPMLELICFCLENHIIGTDKDKAYDGLKIVYPFSKDLTGYPS